MRVGRGMVRHRRIGQRSGIRCSIVDAWMRRDVEIGHVARHRHVVTRGLSWPIVVAGPTYGCASRVGVTNDDEAERASPMAGQEASTTYFVAGKQVATRRRVAHVAPVLLAMPRDLGSMLTHVATLEIVPPVVSKLDVPTRRGTVVVTVGLLNMHRHTITQQAVGKKRSPRKPTSPFELPRQNDRTRRTNSTSSHARKIR